MGLIQHILTGILVFGIIIFIHELGHFIAAKLVGIRIVTFSLGLGPRLWKKKFGDTTFCISALPLGGYVLPVPGIQKSTSTEESSGIFQFLIQISEEEHTTSKILSLNPSGTMAQARFFSKLFFYLNGLIFNIAFAYLLMGLYSYLYMVRKEITLEPRIGIVTQGSPASDAGLLENDLIIEIEGVQVDSWKPLRESLKGFDGTALSLTVERVIGGKPTKTSLSYRPIRTLDDETGKTRLDLGFRGALTTKQLSIYESLKVAANAMGIFTRELLGDFFAKKEPIEIGSPPTLSTSSSNGLLTGIVEIGEFASVSIKNFLAMICGLSRFIVLINALPYPSLDGGQILVLIIEAIRGESLLYSTKKRLAYVGLGSMLVLMLYGVSKDVSGILLNMF